MIWIEVTQHGELNRDVFSTVLCFFPNFVIDIKKCCSKAVK